jgi:hypothetical protein
LKFQRDFGWFDSSNSWTVVDGELDKYFPLGSSDWFRQRVLAMLNEMDSCGFGNCTNHRVCETACPKEVSITHIARFNREYLKAALFAKSKP